MVSKQISAGFEREINNRSDNPGYHKSKPSDAPNPAEMKKAEIYEKLHELGIQHDSTISRPEARQLLNSWVRDNIRPEIVLFVAEAGHEVLFTPPRYSDYSRLNWFGLT